MATVETREVAVAPRPRRRNRMSESAATLASAQAQRLTKQILVKGVTMATKVTVLTPDQFGLLAVDEQYQRMRVGREVNALIGVLSTGGVVADPIHVSRRPDDRLYIVDGQQRFWAHLETNTPLPALIHTVDSIEAEVNLFLALNSRNRLSAKNVVKGWPGPAGKMIRRLNTAPNSPLKGMIDLGSNSKLPLDSVTVAKGLLALVTGLWPQGDTATRLLPRLDTALADETRAKWCEDFAVLLGQVFGMQPRSGRVRVLPVIALGRVAHRKYVEAGRPVFPTTTAKLRAVNWDTVVPSHNHKFLPLLEQAIERRWK